MRNKQYLTAVRPLDGALAMSTMRFADEIVPRSEIDAVPSRRSKPDPKALRLATQIIDSLTSEWNPKKYKDTYTDELRDIIRKKDKGKADVVEEAEPEKKAEVLDLVAALEASVSSAKERRRPRKSAAKKKATSRTKRKSA